MLSLRELQLRFTAALFDESGEEAVTPWIRGDEIDAAARVGIYRNNLREGFVNTLALEFPVIQRLVGEDYFRQLAIHFLATHPSRAGNLHHIGGPFAQFLHAGFASSTYSYLPDIAALEWACQEAMVASDSQPLDLSSLRSLSHDAYAQVRFNIHPACRLVRSAYPVLRIWSANQPGVDTEEVIDLGTGPDFVLIRRANDGIELRRLPAGDFAFLEAVAAGATLAGALEAGQGAASDFDLSKALRRCVALATFTGIRPDESHSLGVSS